MAGSGEGKPRVRVRGAARKGAKAKVPSLAVRKACFLEVLRTTANVSRSAREAGLSSSTVYEHRSKFPAFAASWDAAIAEAVDELEDMLIQRAKHGVAKPVFFAGEQVGSVTSYSDQLAMFLLKARRPETYARDAGSGEIAAPVSALTQDEAKAEVLRRLERLAAPDEGGA